jgi:glycerophosphoryl diester phosphodiesterase
MIPLIEAHRGDSSNAPENTLAAFERALVLGVPWIELDVHPAKDGTLMVIHDDTVDRTTDGSGAVSDLSVEHLLRLDAGLKFSSAYAGERIPRLIDVLEMVAPTATRINVEIKSSPPGMDVPQAIVTLLRRFRKQADYVVSSFDLQSLLGVRAIDSAIALALIGSAPEILAHAERHHLPWIHGDRATLTTEAVMRAHAQGIRVNVWTVDQPERLAYWMGIGVDKICTNRPALMLTAAAKSEGQAGEPNDDSDTSP